MNMGIKVEGKKGTWSVIDNVILDGNVYYILESETWGKECECLCIRDDGSLLMDDVWNGADDVYEYLENDDMNTY